MNGKYRGYWTYERCKEAALKYKTVSEMNNISDISENYRGAYKAIIRNKWIELIKHFDTKNKPKNYWTYEKCKEITLQFNNITEFINCQQSVYIKIKQNKWNELLSHIEYINKPKNYWTYEKCKEITLKYNIKKDFIKENESLYNTIRNNKWVDLLSHMKSYGNKYKRLIYVYEFSNKTCYIGLTYNIINRNNQHIKNHESPVFKFINKTNGCNLGFGVS